MVESPPDRVGAAVTVDQGTLILATRAEDVNDDIG